MHPEGLGGVEGRWGARPAVLDRRKSRAAPMATMLELVWVRDHWVQNVQSTSKWSSDQHSIRNGRQGSSSNREWDEKEKEKNYAQLTLHRNDHGDANHEDANHDVAIHEYANHEDEDHDALQMGKESHTPWPSRRSADNAAGAQSEGASAPSTLGAARRAAQ